MEIRLEKEKELLAEQRLRTYFIRKAYEPSYDYPGRHEDIQLSKRKMREKGHLLGGRREGGRGYA